MRTLAAAAKTGGAGGTVRTMRTFPAHPQVGIGVVVFRERRRGDRADEIDTRVITLPDLSSSGGPGGVSCDETCTDTVPTVTETVQLEALFVRRMNEPAKGTYSFPGGRLRLGESLADCARREVMEETNVALREDLLLPITTVDHIQRDDDGRVRFHYVIVEMMGVFDAERTRWNDADGEDAGGAGSGLNGSSANLQAPRAGSDASDLRWATLEEMEGMDVLNRDAHIGVMLQAMRIYEDITQRY